MRVAARDTVEGMPTVAEHLIESLAEHGVTQVWGVVGDALNPVTDAIRREDRVEWVGVRHEEAAAFAGISPVAADRRSRRLHGHGGARAAIHLLNGLYDAKKSRTPVLAIIGQVPREDMGSDFFQEVDNDVLFADVAVFCETLHQHRPAARPDRAGRATRHCRSAASRCSRCPATWAASTSPSTHRCRGSWPSSPLTQPDPDAVRAAADAINAGRPGHAPGRARCAGRPAAR